MSAARRFAAALLLVAAALAVADPDARVAIETAAGVAQYFDVEIADSEAERARGLMHRVRLDPRAGMLFDFGREQRVTMWMLDTLIPLDMLFIRGDGTIESIAERTEPRSLARIPSRGRVRAVLELAGGTAEALDIRPGDRVRHPLFGAR